MSADQEKIPTTSQFAAYQAMYDHLNATLFGGRLPQVILNFSRGSKRMLGFFAPDRWASGGAQTHEISLNPIHLQRRPPLDVASTLGHEMCHLQEAVQGKPPKNGYHSARWARMMEAIGLVASSTGEPGGKKTGSRMHHYVEPGGKFEQAFGAMPEACRLPWLCSLEPAKAKKSKDKVKYTCPGCGTNVWGKSGLSVSCDDCESPMIPVTA